MQENSPLMLVKVLHYAVECALLYLILNRRPWLLLSFNKLLIEIVNAFFPVTCQAVTLMRS
jgi:hypothetical protein